MAIPEGRRAASARRRRGGNVSSPTGGLDPLALAAKVRGLAVGIEVGAEPEPQLSAPRPAVVENHYEDDHPLPEDCSSLAGIGPQSTLPEIEAALRVFASDVAQLDSLGQEVAKRSAVQVLTSIGVNAPSKLVSAAVGNPRRGDSHEAASTDKTPAPFMTDPEPWSDPVDGAALLTEIAQTFRRFVALPNGAADALALWTVYSHAHNCFAVSPRLLISSPEMRCGKTVTLTVLGALVPRPLPSSNISPAALYRTVEKFGPTLLIDEADTFLRRNDEMAGILNSGHTRALAYVMRNVVRATGEDYEPVAFSTWTPMAIACIGTMSPTLEDRSIIVRLRRKMPGETVEPAWSDALGGLEPLKRQAAAWALAASDDLASANPTVPDLGSDRAVDNWRPLVAVADGVGGEWPERGREAAKLLTERRDDSESARVQLLADIRDLFENSGTSRLGSEEIVRALSLMEERPWPEWYHGQPISTRQLAKQLKPFGVTPKVQRFAGETARGYELGDFEDTFARYLPTGSVTSVTSLQNSRFPSVTRSADVTHEKVPICSNVTDVTHEDEGFAWKETL